VRELRAAVERAERGLNQWRERAISSEDARERVSRELLAERSKVGGPLRGVLHEGIGRSIALRATVQAENPASVSWQFMIGVCDYGNGTMYRDTLEAAILAILEQLRGTFADLVARAKP
jgi:hypothetical protein